jgi:DNA mismatch endonuclease (patch repair protein)
MSELSDDARNSAMADTRTPEQRRRIMQSVRTRDTGPELTVRRILCALGYRYRLNAKNLPGRPDIVLRGRMKAIFVHGCFWHAHGCKKGRAPKSRLNYWKPKLMANRNRDARQRRALKALGWSVLTVWQCETSDSEALRSRLSAFLECLPNAK